MSSLAGLLLFNKGEEGGEEQDGVVEGMELELTLLLQKENTGEVGTATEQDMLMLQYDDGNLGTLKLLVILQIMFVYVFVLLGQ